MTNCSLYVICIFQMVELQPGSGVMIPQEYLSQALTNAMNAETGTPLIQHNRQLGD